MPIRLDKSRLAKVLEDALLSASGTSVDKIWVERVERFSKLCDTSAKTHIAFLGVSMLARSVDSEVDLYFIKPRHAPDNKKAKSYSARSLCHDSFVPFAVKFGIHLGVTGREPLNNQPYFRMKFIGDGTAVHSSSMTAWEFMLDLIKILQESSSEEASKALAAFMFVRKKLRQNYVELSEANGLHPSALAKAITQLVEDRSENGKRAQAAVSAIMDTIYGEERVDVGSGRINDPSRRRPGDISVFDSDNHSEFEKAFEVKDKPVRVSDILIFANTCSEKYKIKDLGYVAVAQNQDGIDVDMINNWSIENGRSLMVYTNWQSLLSEAFFWSSKDWVKLSKELHARIRERLIHVEASGDSVELWGALTNSKGRHLSIGVNDV